MLDLLSQEDEPKDFQEMMVSSALFERKQMRKTVEVEMVLGVIMLVLDVGGRSDDDGTGSEDDGARSVKMVVQKVRETRVLLAHSYLLVHFHELPCLLESVERL